MGGYTEKSLLLTSSLSKIERKKQQEATRWPRVIKTVIVNTRLTPIFTVRACTGLYMQVNQNMAQNFGLNPLRQYCAETGLLNG